MLVHVLLYEAGTESEGIHSLELKGSTVILMFEDKDDAERYCGLLEAQDFPLPTVEMIKIDEIREFCIKLDYEDYRGDQIVEIIIVLPDNLSDSELALYQRLNELSMENY